MLVSGIFHNEALPSLIDFIFKVASFMVAGYYQEVYFLIHNQQAYLGSCDVFEPISLVRSLGYYY